MGEHRATIPLGCVWRCVGLQTVGVGSAFLGMGLFKDDIMCIFRIHVVSTQHVVGTPLWVMSYEYTRI